MSFEELFMRSLVEVALVPRADQWGNLQPSPLDAALHAWWTANSKQLVPQIVAVLDGDSLADSIAEKMLKELATAPGTYSTYDPGRVEREKLRDLVREKVAERIAATIEVPGQESPEAK